MWLPSRWMDSLTQELSSSSAFFPRKVKVIDALAFSTAQIPAVDRINLLNLSTTNRKSVFSHQHSVIHVLLLYLVIMLLFSNLLFYTWKPWKILTLKFTMFGQSVSPTESLFDLRRVFTGMPVCSVMLTVNSGFLYKFKERIMLCDKGVMVCTSMKENEV